MEVVERTDIIIRETGQLERWCKAHDKKNTVRAR